MSQFYAAYQEAHEIVPEFVIRFQNLCLQVARPILEDELKDAFLAA